MPAGAGIVVFVREALVTVPGVARMVAIYPAFEEVIRGPATACSQVGTGANLSMMNDS
jgi:DNA-directed RNA polymerase subunit E'/Rpb7